MPLALVGYHFGPEVELYQQICGKRAGYIQARLDALARAQAQAPPGQLLEEIVRAFVLPVLQLARTAEGRNFLRLIARGNSDELHEDDPRIERRSRSENRPGDVDRAGPVLVSFITEGIRGACKPPRHRPPPPGEAGPADLGRVPHAALAEPLIRHRPTRAARAV